MIITTTRKLNLFNFGSFGAIRSRNGSKSMRIHADPDPVKSIMPYPQPCCKRMKKKKLIVKKPFGQLGMVPMSCSENC